MSKNTYFDNKQNNNSSSLFYSVGDDTSNQNESRHFTNPQQEEERRALAVDVLDDIRIGIRTKGHKVAALEQKNRKNLSNCGVSPEDNLTNDSGSSLNVDEHPELAYMGGKVDPNQVVIPDSQINDSNINKMSMQDRQNYQDRQKRKREAKDKLQNRLKAR